MTATMSETATTITVEDVEGLQALPVGTLLRDRDRDQWEVAEGGIRALGTIAGMTGLHYYLPAEVLNPEILGEFRSALKVGDTVRMTTDDWWPAGTEVTVTEVRPAGRKYPYEVSGPYGPLPVLDHEIEATEGDPFPVGSIAYVVSNEATTASSGLGAHQFEIGERVRIVDTFKDDGSTPAHVDASSFYAGEAWFVANADLSTEPPTFEPVCSCGTDCGEGYDFEYDGSADVADEPLADWEKGVLGRFEKDGETRHVTPTQLTLAPATPEREDFTFDVGSRVYVDNGGTGIFRGFATVTRVTERGPDVRMDESGRDGGFQWGQLITLLESVELPV